MLGRNEMSGGCVTSADALKEWAHAHGAYTGLRIGCGDCGSSRSTALSRRIDSGMQAESRAQLSLVGHSSA